jgi:uncharacterized membrane protein
MMSQRFNAGKVSNVQRRNPPLVLWLRMELTANHHPEVSENQRTPRSARRYGVALVVLAIVLAGFLVRANDIGTRGLSHPEMWVPLIPLSEDIADPPARNSFFDLIDYDLGKDTHPPGFYILMWCWMKVFGWSEWAIRLPSVIFGMGSIVAVYHLAKLSSRTAAGLVAAALLAFNGYHIVWSGIGRMYLGASFFALLSSVLLLQLHQNPSAVRGWRGPLYVVTTLLGVSFHVMVWPMLVAQILWSLWIAKTEARPLQDLWGLQVTAFLAGLPLITFAIYQSHHPVAALSKDFWQYGRELVQFGFLLPLSAIVDVRARTAPALWSTAWGSSFSVLRAAFFIVSAGLFVHGLRSAQGCFRKTPSPHPSPKQPAAPWAAVWLATSCESLLISGAFVWTVRHKSVPIGGTILAALLPIPLTAASVFANRLLQQLPKLKTDRRISLVGVLAIVPFLTIILVSVVTPLFAQREMLVILPFVLIVIAIGVERLLTSRLAVIAICLPLAYLHFESVRAYHNMNIGTVDFRIWAQQVKPYIKPKDTIFVIRAWYGTPLLYYIHPPEYKVFANRFPAGEPVGGRIWWLTMRNETMPASLQAAVSGYREELRMSAGGGTSILFVPSASAESAAVR